MTLTRRASTERLSALYSKHMPVAVRIAFGMTGNRALSEDLAQDAFITTAGRLMAIRNEDSFGSYFYKALVNRVTMHFRRQSVERRFAERSNRAETHEDLDDQVLNRDRLHQALLLLPPRQRAAVVLRFIGDLSFEEVGNSLNCPAGTARSLSSRGVAALREGLDQA